MAWKRSSGDPNIQWFPKAASTAFTANTLVYANTTGEVIPADSTSGDHVGIILKTVASTDSDYASETRVPVDVIRPDDIFEVDVTTGTLTMNMIGKYHDLTDAAGIDVSATSKEVVWVHDFVSASKALVKVNALASVRRVATT